MQLGFKAITCKSHGMGPFQEACRIFYKLEARGPSFLGFLVGGGDYARIGREEVVRECVSER